MLIQLRSLSKTFLVSFYGFLFKLPLFSLLSTYYVQFSLNRSILIHHNTVSILFSIPNSLCHYRAQTFSSKEPETLAWIDSFGDRSIFWDIGANVGLYSIYAAKKKNCSVLSFEPSFFNLEILARNINLNNLSSKISIIPIALTSDTDILPFNLSTLQWGGALSSFGAPIDQHGSTFVPEFSYNTLGISLDDFSDTWNLPKPTHIKMDVDGLEHIILSRSSKVFENVVSILIEVSVLYTEQYNFVQNFLASMGFSLDVSVTSPDGNQFNQIWSR